MFHHTERLQVRYTSVDYLSDRGARRDHPAMIDGDRRRRESLVRANLRVRILKVKVTDDPDSANLINGLL